MLRELCQRHGVELVEGHALQVRRASSVGHGRGSSVDANTAGFLKGKSAIWIHREYLWRQRYFTGYRRLGEGVSSSSSGRSLAEDVIREYIRTAGH